LTFGEKILMQKTLQIGGCLFGLLIFYGALYAISAEPRLNTLFGSSYNAFEYPRIPDYGTPDDLRDFGYRHLGFDPEELMAVIFRPAFELDRSFIRRKTWGGFDYRDVGPREPAPNKPAMASPIPL